MAAVLGSTSGSGVRHGAGRVGVGLLTGAVIGWVISEFLVLVFIFAKNELAHRMGYGYDFSYGTDREESLFVGQLPSGLVAISLGCGVACPRSG